MGFCALPLAADHKHALRIAMTMGIVEEKIDAGTSPGTDS
jgi:hypothetical protein